MLGGIAFGILSGAEAFAAYTGSPPLLVANGGTGATTLTNHGVILGQGTAALVATAVGTNGQMFLGATGADPGWQTMSADATLGTTGALTLATVNGNVGSFTNANITVNGKGLITAASSGSAGGAPSFSAITATNATVTLATTNMLTSGFNQSGTKATTINLPTTVTAGLRTCVKDDGNDFGANPPTVKTTDSSTIDGVAGATGKVMNQVKQELCFMAKDSTPTAWIIE